MFGEVVNTSNHISKQGWGCDTQGWRDVITKLGRGDEIMTLWKEMKIEVRRDEVAVIIET